MSIEIAGKKDIKAIATEIAGSIANQKERLQRPIDCAVPNKKKIVDVLRQLKAILFPGYQASDNICPEKVRECLEERLAEVRPMLTEQIRLAVARDEINDANPTEESKHEEQAQNLVAEFLDRLPMIRDVLLTDVTAAYDGDPACQNIDEVILCYPGLTAVIVYRLAHELHRLEVPFLPRIMSEWVHGETGIDIHPGAKIGNHFFIDHGTGVVIGATCEIGNNVKIYQGVTLGALSFAKDASGELVRNQKRHPTLGDNVVIYANATVLGGKTIVGHDSVIGSSVWLTSSVDPFTTVVMEKPKLRMRNAAPSEFEPPLDFQI